LKTLAESDEQETVREVREFYADLIPLAPHFAILNLSSPYAPQQFNFSTAVFRRCLQALTALILSLNKKPTTIRYDMTTDLFPISLGKIVTIQNFKISARISECTEIGRRISKTMYQR
jgi:hypothetical protein